MYKIEGVAVWGNLPYHCRKKDVIICFGACSINMVAEMKRKSWVNLIYILVAPYIILVFLSNFFMCRMGFYKINDSVLIMLLCSFNLFYIGGIPFSIKSSFIAGSNIVN